MRIFTPREKQRGVVTLLASSAEGDVANSTAKTFSKLGPDNAQCCLWSGLWLRKVVLQICDCINPTSC